MPTTTPVSSFASLDLVALATVTGGCKKKQAPQQACQCQAVAATAYAAAPPPAAPPPPAQDLISTNVQISGY